MKKREFSAKEKYIIASVIAGAITLGIGMLVSFKFLRPVVIPSYGKGIAVVGAIVLTSVLFWGIYLLLILFLNKFLSKKS